jgi:hypothetical protein
MLVSTAFPLLAFMALSGFPSSTVAISTPSDSRSDITYHRITRTLANNTVTVTSPCRSPLSQCLNYCDNTLQAGNTLDDTCAQDCENDLCEFGSIHTPVVHEDYVTTFARFARLASEADGKQLDAALNSHVPSLQNGIGVQFNDCTDTCKSFADAAVKLKKQAPPGFIENLAAAGLCKAVCNALEPPSN